MAASDMELSASNTGFPSSPPYTPAEEPSLPANKPHVSSRLKRLHSDLSYNNSSDPALFSSDELEASVEDYASQRPKKIREGPWFKDTASEQLKRSVIGRSTKKRMTRKYDSGVWMGSESSSFEGDIPSDLVSNKNEPLEHRSEAVAENANHVPSLQTTGCDSLSASQIDAWKYVQRIAEEGREMVDLTGRDLLEIHWEVLKPLQHLILQPQLQHPPTLEDYHHLRPQLRLYLGQNDLSSLPHEIYTLKNLEELSLRNNKLTTLLPHIGDLHRLKTLNVSANRFQYLPHHLRIIYMHGDLSLRTHPNPYFLPISPRPRRRDQITRGSDTSLLAATSCISYLSITGLPIPGSPPAPSQTSFYAPPPSSLFRPPTQGVPSLTELCLRTACAPTPTFGPYSAGSSTVLPHQYPYLVPSLQLLASENALPDVLAEAVSIRAGTGSLPSCAVCSGKYAIPRAEWLEWWDGHPNTPIASLRRRQQLQAIPFVSSPTGSEASRRWEASLAREMFSMDTSYATSLPFLVRTCSWQCAAVRTEERMFNEWNWVPDTWRGCGWGVDTNRMSSEDGSDDDEGEG